MDKRVIFNERLEKWAKDNHCEIDDHGFLHVYKAVHKIEGYGEVHYISDYGLTARPGGFIWPNIARMFGDVIEYKIGDTIVLEDDRLDLDPFVECAPGLHAAGYDFAELFGSRWGTGCILELVIDLKDPSVRIVVPYGQRMVDDYVYKEFGWPIEYPLANKIRVNKMRPIKEVGKCFDKRLDYSRADPHPMHLEKYDWSYVLKVLIIKNEISKLERTLGKMFWEKDADMFKQSLLEADLKEWRNKLGHVYREIRDARFA